MLELMLDGKIHLPARLSPEPVFGCHSCDGPSTFFVYQFCMFLRVIDLPATSVECQMSAKGRVCKVSYLVHTWHAPFPLMKIITFKTSPGYYVPNTDSYSKSQFWLYHTKIYCSSLFCIYISNFTYSAIYSQIYVT
jgi:hypothetical protein